MRAVQLPLGPPITPKLVLVGSKSGLEMHLTSQRVDGLGADVHVDPILMTLELPPRTHIQQVDAALPALLRRKGTVRRLDTSAWLFA